MLYQRSNDPQEAFTSFHKDFIKLYGKCFPIETIKLSYRNRKPWLTNGLCKSIKHKNELHRLKMKYDTPEHCIKYKQYMNKFHDHLLFNKNKTNLKQSWNIIKDIICKIKTSSTCS